MGLPGRAREGHDLFGAFKLLYTPNILSLERNKTAWLFGNFRNADHISIVESRRSSAVMSPRADPRHPQFPWRQPSLSLHLRSRI